MTFFACPPMGVRFVTIMLPIFAIHCILVMHSFAPQTIESYITNEIALFITVLILLPTLYPANNTDTNHGSNGIAGCVMAAIILSLIKCVTMRSDRGMFTHHNLNR